MRLRRGLLVFAAFSGLWAQAPAATKPGVRVPARTAPARKPAATKRAAAPAAAAPQVQAEPAPKIDPSINKVIKTIADRYRALDSAEFSVAVDSGRQAEEDARQSMSKADVKVRIAPNGLYSMEIVEEAEDRPPYQVMSNGTKRWAYVPELKQYEEVPAIATSKPISAVETEPAGPLTGGETYAERLVRQVLPILSRIDQTTDNAFARGNILTLLGKPDANGKGVLLYVTVTNEKGDVSKVSWYQSDGPDGTRMLVRTDFMFSSLKELKPAPEASEFSFTPPSGAALSTGAQLH